MLFVTDIFIPPDDDKHLRSTLKSRKNLLPLVSEWVSESVSCGGRSHSGNRNRQSIGAESFDSFPYIHSLLSVLRVTQQHHPLSLMLRLKNEQIECNIWYWHSACLPACPLQLLCLTRIQSWSRKITLWINKIPSFLPGISSISVFYFHRYDENSKGHQSSCCWASFLPSRL